MSTVLSQLLGDTSLATFIEQHYLKLPLARAGGAEPWIAAGSRAAVEQILRQEGVDALAGREGKPWDGPQPPRPEHLDALLAAGQTLGIRRAHRHDAALAQLAADFAEALAAPIDVHLYYTPANEPGFGWHYDAEDVFILQTHGSKQWSLRKNTVNPWPLVETTPADMQHQREIMPVLSCTLHAGHWLYIPAGYWHRTQSSQESISISVGVLSATGIDVLDFVRRRLLASLVWRQRLPTSGKASGLSDEELLAQYGGILQQLGSDLAAQLSSEELARAFIEARRKKGEPEA